MHVLGAPSCSILALSLTWEDRASYIGPEINPIALIPRSSVFLFLDAFRWSCGASGLGFLETRHANVYPEACQICMLPACMVPFVWYEKLVWRNHLVR